MKREEIKRVLKNLKELKDLEIDFTANDIIECFDCVEGEVIFNKSTNGGYDYIAYVDNSNTEFIITTNKDGTIKEFWAIAYGEEA